tara:strand:+ start:2088 stop:2465 length:378 start_codon:yes stop_codon:yes gene_type:complete
MADELKGSLSLTFSKNSASTSKSESFTIDVTGNAYHQGVQVVANSREDIMDNGDIGAIGYFYLKLLSAPTASTYIEWGYTNDTNYGGKLKVGESCLVRAKNSIAALYVIASAAENVEVEYLIIEE